MHLVESILASWIKKEMHLDMDVSWSEIKLLTRNILLEGHGFKTNAMVLVSN